MCFRRHKLQHPHVVQPVGHFQSDNPDIGRGYCRYRLGYLAFAPSADLVECLVVGHKGRDFATEVAL